MRFERIIIIGVISTIAISVFAQSANIFATIPKGAIPLNDPNFEGVYDAIEVLRNQDYLDDFNFGDYPYDFSEVAAALYSLDRSGLNQSARNAYDYLSIRIGDFKAEKNFEIGAAWGVSQLYDGYGIENGFDWRFYPFFEYRLDKFYFVSRYTIESRLTDDIRYQGKEWNGFGGYGSDVYGAYNSEKLRVLLGRQRLQWGPGKSGGLILSRQGMPLDGINFAYKIRSNLEIEAFTYALDPFRDSLGLFQDRFLSGHRLVWAPYQDLIIGLSEVVIYGGVGRNPEIFYTFPLFFLHGSQLNQNRDDNTLIEADFRWKAARSTEIYGQLLIDDLQVEDKTRMDDEPAEYGFLLGLYRSEIPGLSPLGIRTEYVRIANRVYNQPEARNKYMNRGFYIGHPLGNDVDRIAVELSFRTSPRFWGSMEFSQTRRGEGRVEDSWDTPWMEIDDYSESFPSGVTETTRAIRADLEYLPINRVRCSMGGWYENIRNADNSEGLDDDNSGFEISIDFSL